MANHLTDLPREILGCILSHLEPRAVICFGRTCRQALDLISPSNQLLWRDAFLHVYDDPESAWAGYVESYQTGRSEWDWYQELKSRSLALKALRRRWVEETDKETYEQIINAVLSIIDTAQSRPSPRDLAEGRTAQADDRSSRNLQLLTGILYDNEGTLERLVFDGGKPTARLASDDLGRPRTRAMTSAIKDRSRSDACRRLHTLYGLSARDKRERKHFYRRYVYDWSLTNAVTDFGPFDRDGSGHVNWMLLEAAAVCIVQAFQEVVAGQLSPPMGLFYAIPYRSLPNPAVLSDWAGVTGTWLGTYAFLDYSSLLAFNAGLVDVGFGRSFDLRDEPEVCGDLLRMELQLDDSVRADRVLRSNVPFCEDLPPLYFTGHSRGTDYPSHPRTTIKGFAALTVGGREVKWKFVVEYHGRDQWQLEGVSIVLTFYCTP
jgi:hypothetical protein